MPEHMVVLYDAECVLCSRLVQFIIKRDKARKIRFASLSSDRVADALAVRLGKGNEPIPDSIIVIDGGRLYTHSAAALRIARRLRGGWRLAYAFIIVPRPIRDAVYRAVARSRYRLFGRYDACPLPNADLRSRILSGHEIADLLASG